MSENWVDGTYESGADDEANEPVEATGSEATGDADGAGAEIGLSEGGSFEPEEDAPPP